MLSIWFGKDSTSTKHVSTLFKHVWKQEYLKHEFIHMVLAYVDSCILNEEQNMIWSPVFGWGMPAEYLSDGAKCLIIMYILPKEKFRPNLVICGLNCSAPLAKLSTIKDVNASLSNCTMHFASYNIEELNVYCENNGKFIDNDEEWGDTLMEYYLVAER